MKTVEDCKDEVAREYADGNENFPNWKEFLEYFTENRGWVVIDEATNKAIRLYASQSKQPIAEGETVYKKVEKPCMTCLGFDHQQCFNCHGTRKYPVYEPTTLPLSVNMLSGEKIEDIMQSLNLIGAERDGFLASIKYFRPQITPSKAFDVKKLIDEMIAEKTKLGASETILGTLKTVKEKIIELSNKTH